MEWKEWINQKFVLWRGDEIGNEGSVSAWSRWLGIKQQTVNSWIREGKKPDSLNSVSALVARYGGEVYDILGISPSGELNIEDTDIREVVEIMKSATPAKRREISFAVRAMASMNGTKIVKTKGETE